MYIYIYIYIYVYGLSAIGAGYGRFSNNIFGISFKHLMGFNNIFHLCCLLYFHFFMFKLCNSRPWEV